MVTLDQSELDGLGPEPAGIEDRLLWRDARQMLGRHAGSEADGTCVWCGWRWPCAPRRLAERAEAASRRPWRVAWTLRHDMNSIRAMPGLDGGERRSRRRPNERPSVPGCGNRGYFD
jgi:hypothetical protein